MNAASLLQSPPLLAPLLRGTVSTAGNQAKAAATATTTSQHSNEMQAVQQRLSSLINSISAGGATTSSGGDVGVSQDQSRTKKQYDCAHCSYVTDNKSQYSYHKSLHKPMAGEELKCNYCSYTTTKRMLLTQHMRIHQSNPDDVIVVESESHSVVPKNTEESRGATNAATTTVSKPSENDKENQEFRCPYCPYSDANSELVNDHKKFHLAVSNERLRFSCEFCDFNAHSEKTMKDHRKLHFSFLEKGNATGAVDFCTRYDKFKLYVAASARSADPSKDKKIYDEEEIEDENPWMHTSANTSSSGSGTKINSSASGGGQSKGLNKGGRGGKMAAAEVTGGGAGGKVTAINA